MSYIDFHSTQLYTSPIHHELLAIINFPSHEARDLNHVIEYENLVCTEIDKQKISYIVTTIAKHGKVTLLVKFYTDLNRCGAEVDHVHPLKFISTVMLNPELKWDMKEIRSDYFKWKSFMDGLGGSLTSQAEQNKLSCYLEHFAHELNIPVEQAQYFCERRDWPGLVEFLINY